MRPLFSRHAAPSQVKRHAGRRLRFEALEKREVCATDTGAGANEFACVDGGVSASPAELAPLQSAAADQDYAVLPDLSGWWHGRLTETNPLSTTVYNVTLKFQAFPKFTSVFTGTMWDGRGSSSDFNGSLNKAGRVVIDFPLSDYFIRNQLVGELVTKSHMLGDVFIVDSHGGQTTGTFNFGRGEFPDVVATSVRWNNTKGGLDIRYDILNAHLPGDTRLHMGLFWASGATRDKVIRPMINAGPIPTPSEVGSYTYHVPGRLLRKAPTETTHILLIADPENKILDGNPRNNVFALPDVKVSYDPDLPREKHVVNPATFGIIKDALRYAGQRRAVITSTVRTPMAQVSAMLRNIKDKGVEGQYKLYKSVEAHKVLDAYVAANEEDPTTSDAEYKRVMLASIPITDWGKVSHHCEEPTVLQTVDISPAPENGTTNEELLHRAFAADSVTVGKLPGNPNGRIQLLLDRIVNKDGEGAFHIEVPVRPA